MKTFHPDLAIGRFIPPLSYGPRVARFFRKRAPKGMDPGAGVEVEEFTVDGPSGGPQVSLRVFRPGPLAGADPTVRIPALLWVHGGGLVLGSPEQDDRSNVAFCRELGVVVAAVRYRLAPDSPAPAAVEDVYAGLLGLVTHAERLGVDVDRIAVGGASAGGGLAAAAVLIAHDRGEVRPAFQLLVYPMLDDRTVTRTDLDTRHVRIWTPGSNRYGWASYLGTDPGGPDTSPYAAAARRADLTDLPPAWIGVGSLDLFHDEDLTYARRLNDAGVRCAFCVVPGAFHGFDVLFRSADVSKDFWREQARALREGLGLDRPPGPSWPG